jgi:hypothetical protein
MSAMTRPVGVRAGLLLAATLVAACGTSQPSSDVSVLTTAPGSSTAVASDAPSADAGSAPPPASAPASAAPASPVQAVAPPPKPGNPTFKRISEVPGAGQGTFTDTFKITWTEPDGVADSFLVYGLPDCLRNQMKFNGKPCVVKGMKIPADELTLLETVAGDQRETTIAWDVGATGVPRYSTVLIRAKNSKGPSIFTIVHSEDVCVACTH